MRRRPWLHLLAVALFAVEAAIAASHGGTAATALAAADAALELVVVFRARRELGEGFDGMVALSFALPLLALAALVTIAVRSGSHPTHGTLVLFLFAGIGLAGISWLGARLALVGFRRAASRPGAIAAAAGLLLSVGISLLWFGETIAVLLLNW
jgi:hypothetical protein